MSVLCISEAKFMLKYKLMVVHDTVLLDNLIFPE